VVVHPDLMEVISAVCQTVPISGEKMPKPKPHLRFNVLSIDQYVPESLNILSYVTASVVVIATGRQSQSCYSCILFDCNSCSDWQAVTLCCQR